MRKVIVTGGNGFIGQWLIRELLDSGNEVYSIVRNAKGQQEYSQKLHTILCDMSDIRKLPGLIQERGFDAFYHLAWEGSTGDARADYEKQLRNVEYSCDAIRVARELECKKFMAAGTITERVIDSAVEKGSISPNLIYGITKRTAHNILKVLSKQIGIDFVWMQFSNVFGPGNCTGNLIGYTLSTIIANKSPEFSEALQPYDFIYIKDLVRAIAKLGCCKLLHDEYFIGSGSSRALRDYLQAIPIAIHSEIELKIGARPEDGLVYHNQWFEIRDLQEDTGFEASYSFEEAIKETYNSLVESVEESV